MDQYNRAVSAFGVMLIILSAFTLSLAANSKSPDPDLQQAAYGFAIFVMCVCVALIVLFIVLPLISLLTTIYGFIVTRKRLAKTRRDEELPRSVQ
jgi:TRAP-type C4-dicarboxylate transport system permease small subunit